MPLAFIIVACWGRVPCGVKLNLICVFCALECPAGRAPIMCVLFGTFPPGGGLLSTKFFSKWSKHYFRAIKGDWTSRCLIFEETIVCLAFIDPIAIWARNHWMTLGAYFQRCSSSSLLYENTWHSFFLWHLLFHVYNCFVVGTKYEIWFTESTSIVDVAH